MPRRDVPRPEGGETDAAIIARSLDDPRAFAAIFDRHHDAVYRFAWTRAGPDRADDVAAETFRVAFERRGDYDTGYPSAKPWLLGIASRLAKRTHRDASTEEETRERLGRRTRTPRHTRPHRLLERRRAGAATAEALAVLHDRDLQPLLLHAWDGLSYEEVSQALDVPVGTVRSRIHRARQQVREHLASTAPDVMPGTES